MCVHCLACPLQQLTFMTAGEILITLVWSIPWWAEGKDGLEEAHRQMLGVPQQSCPAPGGDRQWGYAGAFPPILGARKPQHLLCQRGQVVMWELQGGNCACGTGGFWGNQQWLSCVPLRGNSGCTTAALEILLINVKVDPGRLLSFLHHVSFCWKCMSLWWNPDEGCRCHNTKEHPRGWEMRQSCSRKCSSR